MCIYAVHHGGYPEVNVVCTFVNASSATTNHNFANAAAIDWLAIGI